NRLPVPPKKRKLSVTNAAAPSTKKNPRAVRAAAAEGARQFDTSSVETSVALKDDGSFKHTHPLAWGLRGWSVLVVLSVLVEGTSNALRGAFVGAQEWVEWTNSASGFAAQAAAISTGMLLI